LGANGLPTYKVSIDIGGTFTDLIALDETTGSLVNIKIPSTPTNPAAGFLQVLKRFLTERQPSSIKGITHATTIAVNTLLGQAGLEIPKVASISTEGFKDILEIGRQRRHELYNLYMQKPPILVPRYLRFEIGERIDAEGKILNSIDEKKVQAIACVLQEKAVRAVAITLLSSYANPANEKAIEKVLRTHIPDLYISTSSETAPEQREYERTSTAVVNACLMPIVSSYLNKLTTEIKQLGVNAPLYIMQSDGGLAKDQVITQRPVAIVESGPAAGVIASAFYARKIGLNNILSFDMGGTTAKAGTIRGGKPEIVTEYEVAGKIHSGRIIKGSGYPIKLPFIDLAECSAGGGTIAWVDNTGSLKVGPLSAGALPGPACYGKGGNKPTVTDANVVLGRLNPEHLLGGEMPIFPELANEALQREVCLKTGLNLETTAIGIIKIVNSQMSKILRIVSIERGLDPRKFALVCFGGAGPMHACALAEELSMSRVIVPPHPGLFSAQGLLTPDIISEYAQSVMIRVDKRDTKIENVFRSLESKAEKTLVSQGVKSDNIRFERLLDIRYFGQSYELIIPASWSSQGINLDKTVESFHKKHKAIYGYRSDGEPIEIVNARLKAIGRIKKKHLEKIKQLDDMYPLAEAVVSSRNVFFEKSMQYLPTTIYARDKLGSGNSFIGPAIIEQYDATTVVYPGWSGKVDSFGNLVLTLNEA
jgi:N-methylhydantoinase A